MAKAKEKKLVKNLKKAGKKIVGTLTGKDKEKKKSKKKSLMWYIKERARLKAKRAYNKEKMRF